MSRRALVAALLFSVTGSLPGPASAANLKENATSGMRKLFSGVASLYADRFHGCCTASGARFDQTKLTCAHKFLPFGTKLFVKNCRNGKVCTVVVNDRGPFVTTRVLDLSRAAARELGITGVGQVVCYADTSRMPASNGIRARS